MLYDTISGSGPFLYSTKAGSLWHPLPAAHARSLSSEHLPNAVKTEREQGKCIVDSIWIQARLCDAENIMVIPKQVFIVLF